MKATGIVRRIDDLGRVVIPKELRKSMRIEAGAPLEIYTYNGAVCFKPYLPALDWSTAREVAEALLNCEFYLLDNFGGVQAIGHQASYIVGADKEYPLFNQEGDKMGVLSLSPESSEEFEAVAKVVKIIEKILEK